MLGPFCKKHFTARQFYPLHDDPTTFICSQWQRDKSQPNLIYLTYRIAIAILFFSTWVLSMLKENGGGKWPIFLTNWGYTLCTLQSVLGAGMVCAVALAPRLKSLPNLKEKSLKIYPLYWVLYTIATPLAFGITSMYWAVIYDPKRMKFNAMNFFVHGNNTIMMLVDLWMVSHPIRLLHFIYPATFGIMYTLFSVIYYSAGGTGTNKDEPKCIYKILDWDRPSSTALTCIGVTVFLICLHVLTFLVAKVKRHLHERCCTKKNEKENECYMSETKGNGAYVNEAMSNDIV